MKQRQFQSVAGNPYFSSNVTNFGRFSFSRDLAFKFDRRPEAVDDITVANLGDVFDHAVNEAGPVTDLFVNLEIACGGNLFRVMECLL